MRSRRTGTCRCSAVPRAFMGGASFSWYDGWPARGRGRCPGTRSGWRPGSRAGGGRPLGDSEESGDHLLGLLGERLLGALEVGGPRGAVPDLDAGAGADDGAVPAQAGVLAQGGGDGDPALLVGDLVGGAGEEDARVVAGGLAGDGRLPDRLGHADELVHGEDVEAALLPAGDHQTAGEAVAELGRQEESALVVQARGVRAEEHGAFLPPAAVAATIALLVAPLYP